MEVRTRLGGKSARDKTIGNAGRALVRVPRQSRRRHQRALSLRERQASIFLPSMVRQYAGRSTTVQQYAGRSTLGVLRRAFYAGRSTQGVLRRAFYAGRSTPGVLRWAFYAGRSTQGVLRRAFYAGFSTQGAAGYRPFGRPLTVTWPGLDHQQIMQSTYFPQVRKWCICTFHAPAFGSCTLQPKVQGLR